MQIRHILRSETSYPALLNQLHSPPSGLFIRGALAGGPALAVVGTRKATPYGRQAVGMLIPPLARAGVVIVSGLAYGIDAFAHEAALAAGGRTVAVIGSGVDDGAIYPRGHVDLARRIVSGGGAVMSEYPPGTAPFKSHFPERNRIVAALSQAVLVIEAPRKSGAMITARLALEIGREVLAVPGAITSENSWGPNRLIRDGAMPVNCPEDVAAALGLTFEATAADARPSSDPELVSSLKNGPLTVDELVLRLRVPVAEITARLTRLEMEDRVASFGGSRYGLLD
jgi:DNA processing protein